MDDDSAPRFCLPASPNAVMLTWHSLELICELLRKHGSIVIIGQSPTSGITNGPFVSDLVSELTAMKGPRA